MSSVTGVQKSSESIKLHSEYMEQYGFQDKVIVYSRRNYSTILIRKILILGIQRYTLVGEFDFG